MLETVRKTIHKYGMFSSGDSVIAAVSGGPDSVALLHALWTMKEELGISLLVAHLNHGIRGRQADEEARFVKEFAGRLNLPVVVEKVDLRILKTEMKLSFQEAARRVRYDFLRRTAEAVGAARIAVAHNADDQAETVLLNIIRGSGIDGLSGIPPVREEVVRPLIDVCRSQLLEYLAANSLGYRTDPSNLSSTYTRNRVRLELLPLLESRFNRSAKKTLISLSEVARVEADFTRSEAEKTYRLLACEGPEEVTLRQDDLADVHEAIARRVLRKAIERIKGDLRDIELRQVDRILERTGEGRGFGLTLPSGKVRVELRNDFLRVFRADSPLQVPSFEYPLACPGLTSMKEVGLEVLAEIAAPPEVFPNVQSSAVLDADKLKGRLIARNWRPGDRMIPLGMPGHKKLHDMFVDAKIPRPRRHLLPIIADDEKIAWVPGLALSELARVEPNTRRALILRLREI